MANFIIGVEVDDNGAITSLDTLDGKLSELGTTAKKSSTKASSGFKKLEKDTKKLTRNTEKLSKSFKTLNGYLKSITSKAMLTGMAGLTASIAGAAIAMKNLTAQSAEIQKISDNTGVAIKQLSKFATMTQLAGGEIDDMSDAVQDFTTKFGEAIVDPQSSWADAFKKIGVSLDQNVNDAIDETIKKLQQMSKEGNKAGAMFIGDDLFGDAYKRTFSKSVASGGSQNAVVNKFSLSPEVINIFKELSDSSRKTFVMVKKYMAPYLAVIANGAKNMLDKLNTILLNGSPATVAIANKKLMDGIVTGFLYIQKKLSSPLKTLVEFFKNASLMFISLLMTMSGQLSSIAMSLGPLAMIGATLQSLLTVSSAGIAGLTLINPLASDQSKAGARATIANLRAVQLQAKIDELNEEIKFNKSRNRGYQSLITKRDEIQKELNAVSLSQLDREERIEKLKLEKSSILRSTEGWDAQGNTVYNPSAADKQRIAEIEAELKDLSVNFGESIMSIMPELIDAALVAAGYGLAKNANKAAKKASAFTKNSKTMTPLIKKALKEENIANMLNISASMLKAFPMLKDVGGILDWINKIKTLDVTKDMKGMTEDELRAILNNIFTLPEVKQQQTTTPSSMKTKKVEVELSTADELSSTTETSQGTGWLQRLFGVSDEAQAMADTRVSIFSDMHTRIMDIANSIVDLQVERDRKELDSWRKLQEGKLDMFTSSARARQDEQAIIDKETENREEEIAKKQRKMQIANTISQGLSGSAMAFAQAAGSIPPPAGPIIGGINAGLVMTMALINAGKISAMGFSGGGIFGNAFTGAKPGNDNMVAMVREDEMAINSTQQRNLWGWISGEKPLPANNTVNLTIESYTGSDDELSKLEDMLYSLQSSNRFTFGVS